MYHTCHGSPRWGKKREWEETYQEKWWLNFSKFYLKSYLFKLSTLNEDVMFNGNVPTVHNQTAKDTEKKHKASVTYSAKWGKLNVYWFYITDES